MNADDTYRVCRECFNETKSRNNPIIENLKYQGSCNTCGRKWVGINVGYYDPDRRYYEVRRRPFYSENTLCNTNNVCYKGAWCPYAHNKLELEFWMEEEKIFRERKRSGASKFSCVICREEFRDIPNLETHMQSGQHMARTEGMKILPKVAFDKDTYEVCQNFILHDRCNNSNGCKHAHSGEELKVWQQAQRVEEENRRRKWERMVQGSSRSQSASSHSRSHAHHSNGRSASESKSSSYKYQSGASRSPFSRGKKPNDEKKAELHARVSEGLEDYEYAKRKYREIDFIGIVDVIRNRPNHIEILSNNYLSQTLEKSEKEFKWMLRIKSSKPDILLGILLYEHRSMFRLGGVHKGVEGGKFEELNYPYTPKRICYQLHQEMENDTFIDVSVLFMPKIGQHQVNVVLEWMDGVFVARNIKVKVKGVEFREVTKTFKAETLPTPKSGTKASPQETLPVNWEQNFKLMNAKCLLNTHKMPDNMEERIKARFYNKINDKIVKDSYITRFQTLLYLEEFEHKHSLLKYDLVDSRIAFDTVVKEIIVENDDGKERVETAQANRRFIKFCLSQQLFEGYRTYQPPNIAYVIPKHTKTAYECNCVRTGVDYVIFSITIDAIEACEKSGGLAMVRFTPECDEYEKMHEALEAIQPLKEAILFPILRQVRTPVQWDEDHVLDLLGYETLTVAQKEAIYSIINHKYTSFPTIICGPFGCGKTKTLATAARLIARSFYGSVILIATKTNSCANIYVELLERHFDTIEMLRNRRSRKPILFRHFGTSQNINSDRKVRNFTNIKNGNYKRLPLFELKKCSIIVTTTVACSSLFYPKDRNKANNLFTHIFIDEAAQLIEPEACIPLSLAGPDTKVALAGDVRQSRPLILSKQGRQYNLDQSLLERLETLPEYQSESLYQCKISLTENFRSSVEIVQFLSELFYENCLRANPPTLKGPTNFPSLSFLHVKGAERRLHWFPSFYNEEEAEVTVRALKKFARLGVRVENMAVLTTYKSQVRLIYDYLRVEERKCIDLGHFRKNRSSCGDKNCVNNRTIGVRNLEGIQGREYDLIIVNTVRTVTDIPNDISLEEKLDLGLLDDVTQFNTILTRARGWVVVVGDSDCVTNVGDCSNVWSSYVDACEGNKGLFHSVEEFETWN